MRELEYSKLILFDSLQNSAEIFAKLTQIQKEKPESKKEPFYSRLGYN